MARTRYEWTVLCHALWTVGAEVVPIYPRPPRANRCEWILRDSGCVAVLVEDEQGVMTVGSGVRIAARLRHVWQLDAGALDQLAARGEYIPLATVESMRRIVLPDSTAVIAYTSGTSGPRHGLRPEPPQSGLSLRHAAGGLGAHGGTARGTGDPSSPSFPSPTSTA
ncbi:hypothetical protein GCM10019016_133930 [Streptomyces prasinosporus]|uniref:AMP-dependent synthetase/ligase domain-containing protein n=1 Tax=Streptomyces prasinosporus TaxID=68256 RepID=A0ABP6UHS2_9ACTN